MFEDIAYWKAERTKLQDQLDQLEEAKMLQSADLAVVRYLKTRISDIDRHIAFLENRRT